MSGDTHATGVTQEGDEIEIYVEQDVSVSYVCITTPDGVPSKFSSIKFEFNPDFPTDAEKFFSAAAEITHIEIEGIS